MCRKGSLADLAKLAENGKDIAKKLRSGQPALPETSEEGVE